MMTKRTIRFLSVFALLVTSWLYTSSLSAQTIITKEFFKPSMQPKVERLISQQPNLIPAETLQNSVRQMQTGYLSASVSQDFNVAPPFDRDRAIASNGALMISRALQEFDRVMKHLNCSPISGNRGYRVTRNVVPVSRDDNNGKFYAITGELVVCYENPVEKANLTANSSLDAQSCMVLGNCNVAWVSATEFDEESNPSNWTIHTGKINFPTAP